MSGVMEFVVAVALLAGSAPAPLVHPFEIQRVATCRAVVDGKPVEPSDRIAASEGKVTLWFQGDDATDDVDVRTEWHVNGIHEVAASHTIRVSRGSNTGVFTLALPAGATLPVGAYRVDLMVADRVAASHAFTVFASAPPPELPRHRCAEAGFSLQVAPGFRSVPPRGTAVAFQRGDDRDTGVVVARQAEPKRTPVAQVLERARATMAARAMPRLVSHRFDQIDERMCLVAVIEDRDGSRQKAYVVPREKGSASREYYVVVGSSPGARFLEMEAAVDAMARGFRVEPLPAPVTMTFPVLFTAGVGKPDGSLADPATRFPVTERTIHVRFRYEGGTPGQELVGVWHRVEDGRAQEFARSAVKLVEATDFGQVNFSPDGGRWSPGTYRVDLRIGGKTLRSITFTVDGP